MFDFIEKEQYQNIGSVNTAQSSIYININSCKKQDLKKNHRNLMINDKLDIHKTK